MVSCLCPYRHLEKAVLAVPVFAVSAAVARAVPVQQVEAAVALVALAVFSPDPVLCEPAAVVVAAA
jgi:hypothetical protein